MENQSVAQKLEALVKLQFIDTKLDELKKLRGDLPDEVQDLEDEIEGYKTRQTRYEVSQKEIEEGIKKNKEAIKEAEKLIKKYTEQQKNVRNNREFDAITKEIELQELEIQICEKKIKEGKEQIQLKKEEIEKTDSFVKERSEHLETKKRELDGILAESHEEERRLVAEREKAAKKIEDKLLKYYERLRGSLSNGLAVVRVVRGAAEGCNIVIPPQKIAEILEKKKIVIDEHSGRILADVDMDSLDEGDKPKTAKVATTAPSRRKKLSNINLFMIFKKVGIIACLFLLSPTRSTAADPEWKFDATTQKVYELVLNLQIDQVHQLIPEPQSVQEHYITSLAESLELLLTGDAEKFSDHEDRFKLRVERKTRLNNPDDLFLLAEIHLQWAFVYFKFGHEFDAALNLRQAYEVTAEIKRRFPSYQAIKKTSSLLEIIIGSVPEKYDWILGLLNIQGSIETGLNELETMRASGHPLSLETDMLYALVQSYVLQATDKGMSAINQIITRHPTNRLCLFLGASLAVKNAQSETAIELLKRLDHQTSGLPIFFADYLKGEVYLHKAEYLNSITSYRWFINHYKGLSNIKDSHYKIGLCYYLNGNENDAQAVFKLAKNVGSETTEADKYAARSLTEPELPHVKLTKVRYFTDGGYYEQARTILESILPTELPTLRDQVEFQYRMARLEHKTKRLTEAKAHYKKTIELNAAEVWYYAPNACLQLGYLAMDENDSSTAQEYFRRALSYKKHEYKNSIDSKAKTALAQLTRK